MFQFLNWLLQTEDISVESIDEDAVKIKPPFLEGNQTSISKEKKSFRAKGSAQSDTRGLVQPTLLSLFKKVEEKVTSEYLYLICGNRLLAWNPFTVTFRGLLKLVVIFLDAKENDHLKTNERTSKSCYNVAIEEPKKKNAPQTIKHLAKQRKDIYLPFGC